MRLFGLVDNTVDRFDRATFGFLSPFDAEIDAPITTPAAPQGGIYSFPAGGVPIASVPKGSVPQSWPQATRWANYVTIDAAGAVVDVTWRPRQKWFTDRRSR